nr:MAG TPA: hypothetical protein [Caudoviricetes sp.]
MENNKVTTFEELTKYSSGVVMELTPFSESQPFVARLKRPDLIDIVTTEFPNELLGVAYELFNSDEQEQENKNPEKVFKASAERKKVLEIIAKATLVEPSFEEIEKAGMKLTFVQLLEIYEYVNRGVENLKFFREE